MQPAITHAVTRNVERDLRVTLRLLPLVRLMRGTPRGTRDPNVELVLRKDEIIAEECRMLHELENSQSMVIDDFVAAFPRVMAHTSHRVLVSQLFDAWRDAGEALGLQTPRVPIAVASERSTSFVARQQDAVRLARQKWTPRACAQCDKLETEPKQWKLCSRCSGPAYCCKEHQVAHWRAAHKAECKQGQQGGAGAA